MKKIIVCLLLLLSISLCSEKFVGGDFTLQEIKFSKALYNKIPQKVYMKQLTVYTPAILRIEFKNGAVFFCDENWKPGHLYEAQAIQEYRAFDIWDTYSGKYIGKGLIILLANGKFFDVQEKNGKWNMMFYLGRETYLCEDLSQPLSQDKEQRKPKQTQNKDKLNNNELTWVD